MDFFVPVGRQEKRCPDCGNYDFVEDHSQGDVVCTKCGLVVEAHIIDERSEWRTFSDKDKEGQDPNRVGGPNNPLLGDNAMSTIIGKLAGAMPGDGAATALQQLQRLHARSNASDRSLQTAFRAISAMCDRLGLLDNIKQTAQSVYKDITDYNKGIKNKGRGAQALYAACIYVGCRKENNPRTFKEICTAAPEAKKKDIGRAYTDITAMQREKGQAKAASTGGKGPPKQAVVDAIHAADYMRRWCSQLNMPRAAVNACISAAKVAVPKEGEATPEMLFHSQRAPWYGKSPTSISAALIFVVSKLEGIKGGEETTLQLLCGVTGIASTTVAQLYRDMHASLSSLIPDGYATPAELAALPPPETAFRVHKAGKAAAAAAALAAATAAAAAAVPS